MTGKDHKGPFLSIIVPVFNEEASIAGFWSTMRPILANLNVSWEIVFVDDGSTDGTVSAIRDAFAGVGDVRVVKLSRNFGKEGALTAGLDHAEGQVVCLIDVDLQDPPELLGEMIDRWRAGYDVVIGSKSSRENDPLMKRATATAFYAVYNRMSSPPLNANPSDFCLIDRRVAQVIARLTERNRFTKGLLHWPGYRRTVIEYRRGSRAAGTSKFNYAKMWNYALDGLTSFSTVPLRLWTYVGLFVALGGFAYAAFVFFRTIILGGYVPGYASMMVVILVLGGVQLLSLGVLGEYLGRMFTELKQRPVYLVDEVIDPSRAAPAARERETW
jgi:polyisoprenyl-phosphate glycosyltransferase